MMVILYKHSSYMKKIHGPGNHSGEFGSNQLHNKQGDTIQHEQNDDISRVLPSRNNIISNLLRWSFCHDLYACTIGPFD